MGGGRHLGCRFRCPFARPTGIHEIWCSCCEKRMADIKGRASQSKFEGRTEEFQVRFVKLVSKAEIIDSIRHQGAKSSEHTFQAFPLKALSAITQSRQSCAPAWGAIRIDYVSNKRSLRIHVSHHSRWYSGIEI